MGLGLSDYISLTGKQDYIHQIANIGLAIETLMCLNAIYALLMAPLDASEDIRAWRNKGFNSPADSIVRALDNETRTWGIAMQGPCRCLFSLFCFLLDDLVRYRARERECNALYNRVAHRGSSKCSSTLGTLGFLFLVSVHWTLLL